MFGKLINYSKKNNKIILEFEFRTAEIEFITHDIFKVYSIFDKEIKSFAVGELAIQNIKLNIQKIEDYLLIQSNQHLVLKPLKHARRTFRLLIFYHGVCP